MREFWKAAIATVAFGLCHSAVASTKAKRLAAQKLGDRHRDGLYRPFYIAQSFVTFGALSAYLLALPRRELYRVRGPGVALMRAGQATGLVWALLAARAVGIPQISGLSNLVAWLRGEDPGPEPEAQGPAREATGGLRVTGPFRYSRHPLNLSPLPVFWLQPVMTTRLLGFNVIATLYLVLGSAHEERRLERTYGEPYRAYLDDGPPFYLPRPAPRTSTPSHGADHVTARDPAGRVRPGDGDDPSPAGARPV